MGPGQKRRPGEASRDGRSKFARFNCRGHAAAGARTRPIRPEMRRLPLGAGFARIPRLRGWGKNPNSREFGYAAILANTATGR
jgi:hypothetical protein